MSNDISSNAVRVMEMVGPQFASLRLLTASALGAIDGGAIKSSIKRVRGIWFHRDYRYFTILTVARGSDTSRQSPCRVRMGCVSGWRNRNDDRIVSRSHVQPSVESAVMQKLFFGPLALVIAGLPVIAIAQTTNPGTPDRQSVTPTSPIRGLAFRASLAIRVVLLRSVLERRDRM